MPWGMFCEEGNTSNDGIICTLAAKHYPVDGTSGSSQEQLIDARFTSDRGVGCNTIRKSALKLGWESEVDVKEKRPRLRN